MNVRKLYTELSGWLKIGLGVKRWMLVILLGLLLVSIGLTMLVLDLYRVPYTEPLILNLLSLAALRFLPRLLRVTIFIGGGLIVFSYGIWGLNRALLRPFLRPGSRVVEELTRYRQKEQGPRIAAIGGGHGLSTLLRGLKAYTHNLSAIVTVADDGGSSGRLRQSFGILPPGDIRNCLAALSDDEGLLTQLFQYRFSGAPDLAGHSFGNLFLTALADLTGSFEQAIVESGRVLSVHGRVYPSTTHDVRLVADVMLPAMAAPLRVEGESKIPQVAGRVRRVWLEPNNPPAFPPALRAILTADLIVIGPGSLYTSILPNLLVRDILEALKVARAPKIYVCNIATQSGETDFYTCLEHVQAIEEHVGEDFFDVILCNDFHELELPPGVRWVIVDERSRADRRVYCADLVDRAHPWRHDAQKLARVIMEIYQEKTGPLRDS
jgi:uncharacterized cofD-like protein